MLKMVHDDIDAVADTTIEAYNANWAPRGWKLLEAPEAFASEILGKPVKKIDDLLADEIKALHSARGLEYPLGRSTKADLEKTYRDSFEDAPALVDSAGDPSEAATPALATVTEVATVAPPSTDATPATDTTKKKD